MRWPIVFIVAASVVAPALAADLTSTRFRVRSSTLTSGGQARLAGVDTAQGAGLSIAQPGPTGLGETTAGEIVSSGFWSRAGAPIDPGSCVGDCGADGAVTVDEIVLGVNIALGAADIDACRALDRNGDGAITVDEIITSVNNALAGCETTGGIASGSAPPQRIGIQGSLEGEDEPVDIELSLWTAISGGEQLYRETQASVDPVNGVFDVQLGAGSAQFGDLAGALTPATWLEVAVDGEQFEPRVRITSAPYALRAGRVAAVASADRAVGMPPGSMPVTTAGAEFGGSLVVQGPETARVVLRPPNEATGASLGVVGADGAEAAKLFADGIGLGGLALLGTDDVGVTMGTRRTDGGGAGLLSDLFGDGGFLETTGPNGNSNVQMTALRGNENHGYLSVDNAAGESRAGLFVDTQGAGRADLRDTDGRLRSSLTPATIRTVGPSGATNVLVTNLSGDENRGFLLAANAAGEPRAALLVDSSADGALQLRDAGGGRRLLAHAGTIETFASNGVPTAALTGEGLDSDLGSLSVFGNNGGQAEMSINLFNFGVFETRGPDQQPTVRAGGSTLSPNSGQVELFGGQLFARARLEHVGFSDEAVFSLGDGNRTRLQLSSAGTAELFSSEGLFIAALGTDGDHGFVMASNAAGGAAFLSASERGGEAIVTAEPDVAVAAMEVLSSGAGLIETRGPDGIDNVRLTTPGDNPNEGFLSAVGDSGASVAQMLLDIDGNGLLTARRPAGSLGAQMAIVDGLGILEARGRDGNSIVNVSARGSRSDVGSVTLANAAGQERVLLLGLPLSGAGDDGTLFVRGPNGQGNVTALSGTIFVQDSGGGAQVTMSAGGGGLGFFSADVKNFVADHPTRPKHKIVYTVLEGPQADVYHRGTARLEAGRAVVELPEHFLAVADSDSITVQLTAASAKSSGLGFDLDARQRVMIFELHEGAGSYPVYYLVHAQRRGFEDREPVVTKDEIPSPDTEGEPRRVELGDRGDTPS